MTADQVVESALARIAGTGDQPKSARSPFYYRIGVRQQQLFVEAAKVDPEFYGVCAIGILADGAVSVADMTPPVRTAAAITRIEVEDPGTSDWTHGQEVIPVRVQEIDYAHDGPRALLRNRAIIGVAGDLDGVVSIKVSYPYQPEPITAGDTELELPDPFGELCVIDLAKWMLRRIPATELVQQLTQSLGAEEEAMLADWAAYVGTFAESRQGRFSG